MFPTMFWLLAVLWLISLFVSDDKIPGGTRSKGIVVLIMLLLLGHKVYPFNG